jgi:hypothetical protein
MVYACPTWDYAVDTHLLKLQNQVLHTIGNFDRCTLVCNMHVAFRIPYVYDYITKLCRKKAEVIQNALNPNAHANGQGEAMHRKHKRLKLGSVQAYDCSSD